MTKRILIITNMYPSARSKTFGIFVQNQVRALQHEGLHVDVLAITNPLPGKKNVMTKYGKWFMYTIVNFITKGKTYDVVHAHYAFPSGLLALAYKKICKTKMVVTVHGGDMDKMVNIHPKIQTWTKKILHHADVVIPVGDALEQTLLTRLHVPIEKITKLSMGVNTNRFYPMNKTEAKQHCHSHGKQTILFVGNIIKAKGLEELLSAFNIINQHIHHVELVLIGSSPNQSFLSKLKEQIHETSEKVRFVGPLPQTEIVYWMNAADVVVLPSHIEGFGLVALEAMACNTPVVGTNVGGLKYLLANACGLLVEPHQPKQLANSIMCLLQNEELKEQIIKNSQKRVLENSNETIIAKLLELYDCSEKRLK